MGKVKRIFADNKYHNFALYAWVESNVRWRMEIARWPEGATGWVLLRTRWTVERTFAWLGNVRRRTLLASAALVKLGFIRFSTASNPRYRSRSVIV